ncbi:hypothetical protein BKH30_03425 [Actinomyces oris]|uniref:Uncharacterized protein n=1 Tax=Actinomyces oris TaxID=544580 RepID=A0A1Q8W138_9ACTO|nr:hypothetical protein BKH30_03425 [Actinomyces oris]
MRSESYAHIWDAPQAVRALRRFTQGMSKEKYLSDLMLSSAVERQIEVLGEALNRVRRSDPQAADQIPDIEAYSWGVGEYESEDGCDGFWEGV